MNADVKIKIGPLSKIDVSSTPVDEGSIYFIQDGNGIYFDTSSARVKVTVPPAAHSHTPAELGAVPTSRTVNNKALSSDISLTAADVGAIPTTRKVNNKALSADISLTASDVGAVPTSRTVNNKALSANIALTAADVSALPLTGGTLTGPLIIGKMKLSWDDASKTLDFDGVS